MSQLTKRAIIDCTLDLAEKKSFRKITVRDIVTACGITRNTFYYYFHDIYDVIDQALEEQTALATKMELKMLQSQINPHFLFNTINTIASFTRTDPARALVAGDSVSADIMLARNAGLRSCLMFSSSPLADYCTDTYDGLLSLLGGKKTHA